jgi:ABC-type cobalamin transport system permease subunit
MPSRPVIETPVERTAATKVPIALVGSGVFWAGVIAIIGVTLPHLALPVEDEKVLFAGFVVALDFSLAMVATDLGITGV